MRTKPSLGFWSELGWVMAVAFLSLPSIAFVVLHATYNPGRSTAGTVVGSIILVTGDIGVLTTVAASVVAAAGTMLNRISEASKTAIWCCCFLSAVACTYLIKTPM